ncbi:unnamed protein product [Rotaria sp. Silwood2]|nr:unnamed protein product [Rotaria sp. Silwood2]
MTEQAKDTVLSPLVIQGLPKFISFICHRFFERALWAFVELGIADLMADYKSPITAAELSQLNGNSWNIGFVYRLLQTISDADIVQHCITNTDGSHRNMNPEHENHFQLTNSGLFLTTNHPSKARDMIRLHFGPVMDHSSRYLPDLIRHGYSNGNGFEQAFEDSLFDYLQREENQDYSNMFDNAMSASSNYVVPSMARNINFSRFETLVDVGGGLGTLLAFILEKYPKLNGIVFDLEHVIENAKKTGSHTFQQKGIEFNRHRFIAGDMFKFETIPAADSYMLKFIIHDWDDEKSVNILKSIRMANRNSQYNTVTIFLVEMILLSDDISNWEARATDMEMLTNTGAKERTKDEYVHLLKLSGYEFKQLYRTDGFYSIIEAISKTELSD